MAEFIKHTPEEWKKAVKSEWFTPRLDIKRYHLVNPESREELWSGSSKEIFLAHIPDGCDVIKVSLFGDHLITKELLSTVRRASKVLIKSNNTGFVGAFINDARLLKIMKANGIGENADLQPIAMQPAMIKGIVDALMEEGTDEIHIGENML